MIDIIADLHLHSKYSRAVSPQMMPPTMSRVGATKGIELLATGDWTHPLWFRELQNYLEEAEEGLYSVKRQGVTNDEESKKTRFLLSVEIATIFSQKGKGRRIHQLIFVPSFDTAAKVNKELLKRGFNLTSDGRPILGLSSKNLLQLVLEIDERALIIPAHVWTPWFGIYGQMSGFNSLEEAYEDLAPYVYGIETGLSSDPEMNWQMDELKTRSILSFSDAHSPAKMGREATVFRLESLSYDNIRKAIMEPSQKNQNTLAARNSEIQKIRKSDNPSILDKVLYTIEFYPEEGKYHYSGHRNCGVSMTPQEQTAAKNICPVCHRSLTDGVMRRVQELAQKEGKGDHKANQNGLVWVTSPSSPRPPFVKIVPLQEIIAESLGRPVASPKVQVLFEKLCRDGQSEFYVLLKLPLGDIERILATTTTKEFAEKITDGIKKVRSEKIVIRPGYDGIFGVVKIWPEDRDVAKDTDLEDTKPTDQIGLF